MKRFLSILGLLLLLVSSLTSCFSSEIISKESVTEEKVAESESESEIEGPTADTRYLFDQTVSKDVLCNYLSRAVTIASTNIDEWYGQNGNHIKHYIQNTGAKYIARSNAQWIFSKTEDDKWGIQKAFIDAVHEEDPDVVFEACIFENIWKWGVIELPIPAYVFEAFGLDPEERNFSYTAMLFPSGKYVNQWDTDQSVPDITQLETQMFIYYRATRYIDAGFEGLHLGQVHLIGADDTNWECWTDVVTLIREYATEHARRHFVFLNAHTHGITDSNGQLLLDFHGYPLRLVPVEGQVKHGPSEDNPQEACFETGYLDSIYGDSLGGTTYSGWECDSLPYLVEFDNFGGVNYQEMFTPNRGSIWIWGLDEISWFGSQPEWYREEFLDYAVDWLYENSDGIGFLAMPAQREARLYAESGECTSLMYYGYSQEYFGVANNDELLVKKLWARMEKTGR